MKKRLRNRSFCFNFWKKKGLDSKSGPVLSLLKLWKRAKMNNTANYSPSMLSMDRQHWR